MYPDGEYARIQGDVYWIVRGLGTITVGRSMDSQASDRRSRSPGATDGLSRGPFERNAQFSSTAKERIAHFVAWQRVNS
jgi:hypothetical protein